MLKMGRKDFLKLGAGALVGGMLELVLPGGLRPATAAPATPRSLFDETRLGSMTLKNRFLRSATGDRFAVNGHMTARDLAVYETLARGGVGTIITGFTTVSGTPCVPGMFGIVDDSYVAEFKTLTDRVHELGAAIMMQLVHCGSFTLLDAVPEDLPGPSPVRHAASGRTPRREMTVAEIRRVQEDFAAAAGRAKRAGFDGVELHMAHGFLLSQFQSPHYNRRRDAYGGSDANRSRMSLETCAAVREAVGPGYPVFAKINCTDGVPGGVTREGFALLCRELARTGLDAIAVSGSWQGYGQNDGVYFLAQALAVAGQCGIPVFPVGGNRDFGRMTELLNATTVAYFPMSRPLVSEPALVRRWQEGDTSPSRCITCNTCITPGHENRCIFDDA